MHEINTTTPVLPLHIEVYPTAVCLLAHMCNGSLGKCKLWRQWIMGLNSSRRILGHSDRRARVLKSMSLRGCWSIRTLSYLGRLSLYLRSLILLLRLGFIVAQLIRIPRVQEWFFFASSELIADISHWRSKKDNTGVSFRTIVSNVVMYFPPAILTNLRQTIIFLVTCAPVHANE